MQNFKYDTRGSVTMPRVLDISIFSDKHDAIHPVENALLKIGHKVISKGSIDEALSNSDSLPHVDIVILDVEKASGELCEALGALDDHACKVGHDIIIKTSLQNLDDLYGCFRLSNPHILISTGTVQLMLAVARVEAGFQRNRVREENRKEDYSLFEIGERIAELSRKIDEISSQPGSSSTFQFGAKKSEFRGADSDGTNGLVRKTRAPLPEPRLVRSIVENRQARAKFFDAELFADPAWDILLDLTAARAEHKRVSVTSLCIAAGVPPTTALRWISQMTNSGLLQRVEDDADKRRAFIALSDRAADAMSAYFAAITPVNVTAI